MTSSPPTTGPTPVPSTASTPPSFSRDVAKSTTINVATSVVVAGLVALTTRIGDLSGQPIGPLLRYAAGAALIALGAVGAIAVGSKLSDLLGLHQSPQWLRSLITSARAKLASTRSLAIASTAVATLLALAVLIFGAVVLMAAGGAIARGES